MVDTMQKKGRELAPRTRIILRELLGPNRAIPTMGMIAANTKFSRSMVCYVFLGRRMGSLACLRAIAGYLGVGLEALDSALTKPRPAALTPKVDVKQHRRPRESGAASPRRSVRAAPAPGARARVALDRLKAKAQAARSARS